MMVLQQKGISDSIKKYPQQEVAEHSIGLLKGRFRRLLHGFTNIDIEYSVMCVLAACVLHNICITHQDVGIEHLQEDENENPVAENNSDFQDGITRRNTLLLELFPN